ncbi:MAG TPA: type II toxin-antitoxin system VapC family toxin [Candidatus Lustribacter sp.]|nr:type II toxin-antitoxin system VapC family toxin [Candidatus Lustribacter sp.]
MIVVDASVLANAIGDDAEAGRQARDLLREHREVAAPDLVDVETTAVLRRRWLAGTLTDERFEQAVDDLADIPLARFPARGLMRRAFELRAKVTAYDACYVALAEALGWPLCTADRRLTRATGPRCTMHLIAPPATRTGPPGSG